MSKESSLVEKIQTRVFDHFINELPDGFVFHNFQHTQDTVDACLELGKHYGLSDKKMENLLLAAWLHDVGYTETYDGHEEVSQEKAKAWLKELKVEDDQIDDITTLIASTEKEREPEGLLQEILHDADILHIGKKGFFHKSEMLRMEWERVLNLRYSNTEWQQNQIDFLIAKKFTTQYAESEYGSRKEKNLKKQRKELNKSRRKREKRKVNKIKTRKLGRGIETMYRSTYRNHINLSSIADAKANMMISLNTIIMSVIITVVGSGFAFGGGLFESIRFTVPITILLVGSLIAVIFAVISARPDVTKKDVDLQKIKNKQSSVLFFGNFTKLELKEFVKNMQELKADRDILYDNMSIDIYYLGKVLTRKYRLLRYSYTIFISGLTLSVLSFLFILTYTNL